MKRAAADVFRSAALRGLTLLEVMLAIAILGGCLAVIGELVRLGVRHAEEAREQTKAQLLCESKLEEIAAGIAPLEGASAVPFELDPDWTYTVEVTSLDQQGLIQVSVTVQPAESERLYPITFALSRWMLDPSLAASGELPTDSTGEGQTIMSGSSDALSN
jgi:general secretion pathway protein I